MPATRSWPRTSRTRRSSPTSAGGERRRLAPRLATFLWLAFALAAHADDETCLGCHGDPALDRRLASGETVSLHVDAERVKRSVHAGLECVACHAAEEEIPHLERPARSRAEFRQQFRAVCSSCHEDKHALAADGVHSALLEKGDTRTPGCADCHGSHEIVPPARPRSQISRTCSRCHAEIGAAYAKSVHGRALIADDNPDVPACTDCHRAHDIKDPRDRAWLLDTPKLCARCHSDETIARRYNMSPRVVQTYLADFHGMTASLHGRKHGANDGRFTAVCVDCHGVHDIARTKDPESRVVRANLVRTCRTCHPGATENFPAAWLSHYEPTPQRFPLVYGVKAFYLAFVPLVIGGLVLQIGLHLRAFWRGR